MLVSPKTLAKLKTLETIYLNLIFEAVADVPARYCETDSHERQVPGDEFAWKPCPPGTAWGKPGSSAWFRGRATVPDACADQPLFVRATGFGPEALVFVDGTPRGILNAPAFDPVRGPHVAVLVTDRARPGQSFDIAVEAYAGHPIVGTQPYDTGDPGFPTSNTHTFQGLQLLNRRDDIVAFAFDLMALNRLSDALPADSSRKGAVDACLQDLFRVLHQYPSEVPESVWRPRLAEARDIMRPLLAATNGSTAPRAGLIGHSHMDTAWLWTIDETIRKCARTYANTLAVMDQYPEYTFVQSSMVHADFMRLHYPDVFRGIQQRVAEGRWEPIGGAWVEPDCNLASGESLVRHFLRGHAFTRDYFDGYRSDVFWLPDTFGYSAALPQILRGCGIRYFCTTKLSWNDTNKFPYDTFRWQGIDGTDVLAHFNVIHCWPDPKTLIDHVEGSAPAAPHGIRHKDVNRARLISYGHGDGGGGPPYAMPELARRVRDLEGCPRAQHTTVSRFMRDLEQSATNLPTFAGELYLEGHRGTLTQQHQIKRNNRKLELALRDLELASVLAGGPPDPSTRQAIRDLWDTLLINQFHDILPGTSIPEVNDRAVAETQSALDEANRLTNVLASSRITPDPTTFTILNSLSWPRLGELSLSGIPENLAPADDTLLSQRIESVTGHKSLLISGIPCPPLSLTPVKLKHGGPPHHTSPFPWDGHTLDAPHLTARFDDHGGIASLLDRATGRDLRRPSGLPLNTFLLAEDVPGSWDNWDIDADLELKMIPQRDLLASTVVADGPLQFRLRQTHRIGLHSTLQQDIVFHRDTPQIDFETVLDWHEVHAFLKVGFDLNLLAPSARYETQYGHLERPTHRNFPEDRARFEVAHHKWCDLAENRFGVALLNDCKYGISARSSDLRLSLHKGGRHPDPRGDAGRHTFTYALLPHTGPFTADSVARPAYQLNIPPITLPGRPRSTHPLFTIDAPNVIAEAIKWSEDPVTPTVVLRLYECERSATRARLTFGPTVTRITESNLLEEPQHDLPLTHNQLELPLRPFEIKTLVLHLTSKA